MADQPAPLAPPPGPGSIEVLSRPSWITKLRGLFVGVALVIPALMSAHLLTPESELMIGAWHCPIGHILIGASVALGALGYKGALDAQPK